MKVKPGVGALKIGEFAGRAKVVRVAADSVGLDGGAAVPADVIIWASGVRAQQLRQPMQGLRLAKNGRISVDATLRVLRAAGGAFDAFYSLGDCAAAPLPDGSVVGATAQAAHQQAVLLARSLARQLRGRAALSFRFRYRGSLVSLGEGAAVGDVPSLSGHGDLRLGRRCETGVH